jgi:hypothetical protein
LKIFTSNVWLLVIQSTIKKMKHFTPIIAKTLVVTGFVVLPILATAPAQAAVMTFESLALNDNAIHNAGSTYTESGFTISYSGQIGLLYYGTQYRSYQGSTALFPYSVNNLISLTKVGGGAFDLASIDLTDFTGGSGTQNTTFNFTGTRADNSTVNQSVTVDDLRGFQTFNFSGFNNLAKVEWQSNSGGGSNPQFDNINVSAAGTTSVPEPFTIIGTVIGGTAAVRIRRKLNQARE